MKGQYVQKVVGNRGPARSGATSAWFGKFRVRNSAPGCISELSGSVSGSFRGRRMWPLARKSTDPGEACGAVLAKGSSEEGNLQCRGTGRGG